MQLAIVGGGGFRTPLVYRTLLRDRDRLIDRVVLIDDDPQRLAVIEAVLHSQTRGADWAPSVRCTTSLRDGLTGSSFVFVAIRPGGTAGRELDENIPLRHGVLGQETVGLGGILYALRSIPAMREIAQEVRDSAPDSWLINFTNPAGMVTEAIEPILPGRVIGICDSPTALIRRVCRALGVAEASTTYDYLGLNHLGWLRSVRSDAADLLPRLLTNDAALASFEEGQLFGGELLRALGCIPNEYLHYFYFAADVLAAISGRETRATQVANAQREFYSNALAALDPAARWQAVLDSRNRTYMATSRDAAGAGDRADEDVEGGGYEQIALGVMRSLATDAGDRIVLGVPNGGTIDGLASDAIVEIPCIVGSSGARPLDVAQPTLHQLGLMQQLKAVERATITAAVTGDRDALEFAIATHPLNGSYARSRAAVDEWFTHFPEIAARFT